MNQQSFLEKKDLTNVSIAENELSAKDKAKTLTLLGEDLLQHSDPTGVQLLDDALTLDSENCDLLYKQGLSLFEYGLEESSEKLLMLATKRLKKIFNLQKDNFPALRTCGDVFLCLGKLFARQNYFQEAQKQYLQASHLITQQPSDIVADFVWNHGLSWLNLAEFSGEASDISKALALFKQASSLREKHPIPFWNDFGSAYIKLANKLNDPKIYLDAIHVLTNSLVFSGDSEDTWLKMAECFKGIYLITGEMEHFKNADESFSRSIKCSPTAWKNWKEWALFLYEAGRLERDEKKLLSCIEKCRQANLYSPENALTISTWSNALSELGVIKNSVDYIYEAENKITSLLDSYDHVSFVWHSYGKCLHALGVYFNELDYYYQAIEKFQEGLSLDKSSYKLWYSLAETFSTIALANFDNDSFLKASRIYSKAVKLHDSPHYLAKYATMLMSFGEFNHNKRYLEKAISLFEKAFSSAEKFLYQHSDWLFDYACALDALGNFQDDEFLYDKAIKILSHVLMINPNHSNIHHRLGVVFTHRADLLEDISDFRRAEQHFRMAYQQNEEDDQILIDWGVALTDLAKFLPEKEAESIFIDAETKIIQAAKLGNLQSYYYLGCIYSLRKEYEKSIFFLEKGREFESLPPKKELLQDDWLAGVRDTDQFKDLLAKLEK